MTHKRNIAALCERGFKPLASWKPKANRGDSSTLLDYEIEGNQNDPKINQLNVLYAFGSEEEVYYIGKTTQSIRKRFIGYCNPGNGKATNWRCNEKINSKIKKGEKVFIYVFFPPPMEPFHDLEINLAAGLEDVFIQRFKPPWNGGNRTQKITETQENEKILSEMRKDIAAQVDTISTPFKHSRGQDTDPSTQRVTGQFLIKLGRIYYRDGFVNPGIAVDGLLGAHREKMIVHFSDDTSAVETTINRTANLNGSVRFIGNNSQIARWFQKHFNLGDRVEAQILNRNEVLFLAPKNKKIADNTNTHIGESEQTSTDAEKKRFHLNNNAPEHNETSTTISTDHPDFQQQTGRFTIKLGKTYYKCGYINPGVDVDKLFGRHDEKMAVYFSDETSPVISKINRTDNNFTKAVRLNENRQKIAEWFQHHFKPDDIVQARILNPHAVLLLAPEDVEKY